MKAYDADPLNYRGKIPVRTAVEMMLTARKLDGSLASPRLPILLLRGTEDRLVPAGASQFVHDRVLSPDKTLLMYDGLYHGVFNEPGKGLVLSDLGDWLYKHVGRGGACFA